MKRHFFKTFEFEFETTRLLWYTPSGGSDYGEVATTAEKIKDGDYESWYQEWAKFAGVLEQRATDFTSQHSKANSYLRASRYYQAAEFFLAPSDPRKLKVYQKSIDLFYQGLALKETNYIMEDIDYKNAKMRTVFFRTTGESKGTLFVCGGFDALLEELYFTNVKAGLAEGYDVVLYEGPGQSDMIRKYKLSFEADWDQPTKKVVDFYCEKYQLAGPKIGIGLSLGGLLMARAASKDQTLFDKIVLYNYFPAMVDSFKSSMPKFLHRSFENGLPQLLEKICSLYISHNKFLNWQIEHAKWTFGEESLNNLLKTCRAFNEEIATEKLTTDTLILLAENENYYNYQYGLDFYEKIPAENKKLILYNKTNFSSDLHCQNGAAYDSNDQIFEWLNHSQMNE
ncbi:dipeptidyl aminopeptidase [Enterococcus sp. JM4C]|uniref:serine aminopeptidase domain-containing protein n=1 Tax=Candidatus Enterococcus huntleyi TaxID=1857217 RepID=UPI00137B8E48|nr:alpha/beta hydrolase [Enterococcus sp. JM4C]KAF1299282.1 dipeptidyl aminopeptidase [Enterococcus sp. JM4C]